MKITKHYLRKMIFIVMLMVIAQSDAICAKEKILWPYVCFNPVYICRNKQVVDGSGFHIINLMQQQMPGYEHKLVQMPIKRILENAKQGDNQLFYGLYKTTEREAFLQFSIPCRISTPIFIVVRKTDRSKFGNGERVFLKDLLGDKKLTFLHLQSISFRKEIDAIIEEHKDGPNVLTEYDTGDMNRKSLKLLLSHRIDYMLSLDGTQKDAAEMGIADEISYLSISEQDKYEIGYIVAPKNEWGKTMINRVNAILRKSIPTEAFFEYFTPLVNKTMVPTLRQKYNELILSPAREKPEKK